MHWSVEVTRNGESLVTIESACLSGKAELTRQDRDTIRTAAIHLKAFVGDEPSEICECPGYDVIKGPYPSGICRDCGRWYPPKRR